MNTRNLLTRFLLGTCFLSSSALLAQTPDFSGTWLPVPESADSWQPRDLPLTDAALARLDAFEPARLDSTFFCMPFGTPRNMLNTAPMPFDILQTDSQVTLLFDGLGDIRRIFTDGRAHPEDPIPGWMGSSVGRWQGDTLVVDTIALTAESILDDAGLPHSEELRVSERLSLVDVDGEALLQDQLTLSDPAYYNAPITAIRRYRRAPNAQFSEGSSQCLLDMWRQQLETLNREMYSELQNGAGEP